MTSEAILSSARRHEATCRAMAGVIAASWTWDPVYCAATTSIDRENMNDVADRLQSTLPLLVNNKTLRQQEASVRDLAMWAGGLERRQRLFVGPVEGRVALFATLWPWTEDEGCTVRIGLFHPDARIPERAALGELLRTWFALS